MNSASDWPHFKSYSGEYLRRIALPLGGIGTGCVSLGGRGDLRDWEVVNRPAKGFNPPQTFFALRAEWDNQLFSSALEGPMALEDYEGPLGCPTKNHGLPRFRSCSFDAAYPLGQVLLDDPRSPVSVVLQAFNPLVPGDSKLSGLPMAFLRYALVNKTEHEVRAAVCGSLGNFVGFDGTSGRTVDNFNEVRESRGLRGIFLGTAGTPADSEQWGSLALSTTAHEVTHRTAWAQLSWGDALLDFWDDFCDDGRLDERAHAGGESPTASLAASVIVPPGGIAQVSFLLTWHFPNRVTWTPKLAVGEATAPPEIVGNFYALPYRDAWHVAECVTPQLGELEAKTVKFVRAFCTSDLPDVVKEAALFNISTLRTQTCFRTADGHFFGWEGCHDNAGSCYGSATHVWSYESALAYVFGDLSRSMREVQFLHATRENGSMSYRVNLPLERAQEYPGAAADGQMACIMKLLRDWELCGDDLWLRRLWPKARKALEFSWIDRGWDPDQDGVMEGCQHNTMDVEYFGPNPQMAGWYLGALRAARIMALAMGESEFSARCAHLFEGGRAWIDGNLFNGEYYEHHIRPAGSQENIAAGLRHPTFGTRDLVDPEFQLGTGCLVDQMVGQYMAHLCDLGDLLDPAHIRMALQGVMRHNFREALWGHFNHLRSFALDGESALLMASYPRGNRPRRPFPYYNEAMTGFEYSTAVHLIYEGEIEAGLKVITAIRERYDGLKRNPFNEAECGHHYARAMASWSAVIAMTGFHWNGRQGVLTFNAATQPVHWFWSNGGAWGVCRQQPEESCIGIELEVLGGVLPFVEFHLRGYGFTRLDKSRDCSQGISLTVERADLSGKIGAEATIATHRSCDASE